MASLADSLVSSAERVLSVYARSDLEAKRATYLGRSFWIVKDPIGLKYYRFQDEEYFILESLDGTKSLETIKEEFEEKFPPQKITLEEIQSFVGQLHQCSLIVVGVPDQGHELLKRRKKRRRQEILAACSNILAIRFKGVDPNRFFDKCLPYVRWFFHPVTLICCMLLMASALLLIGINFDHFRSKLPEFRQFFGPGNLLLLSVVLVFTKILHEFGHGFSCKVLGGECHELGVMILVLTPCLYCNVSDSWMLPSKWKRAGIGIAGVFVECTLASIATFIWWFTKENTLHYLCLNIMFISSVSTIVFNINPLLRYDGYYILADLLEIPNLRQKATKIMSKKAQEWFLGMETQEDPFLPKRNQFLFALYTVAAVCYRWVVMASILFFIWRFFDTYGLKIIAQIIAAMSLYGLLGMPLWKIGKFFWVPGRIYKVKKSHFYPSLAGVLAIIAACCFVKLPYSIYAPAVLELRSESESTANVLAPKSGGILDEIHVREGQYVHEGDLLVTLRNPQLYAELNDLKGQIIETQRDIETCEQLGATKEAVARLQEMKARLVGLIKARNAVQTDVDRLKLVAPIDGIVVSPYWRMDRDNKFHDASSDLLPWDGTPLLERNLYTTVEPGVHVCSIGDPKKLEAVIVVDQARKDDVAKGQKVKIKLTERPAELYYGEIKDDVDIERRAMSSVPYQLSVKGGGPIATETGEGGEERPQMESIRVRVDLDNDDELMRVGMTAKVKIKAAPKTLLQRLVRLIGEVFNFKL
ncbi:MAG: biotin/lipoyl-binding protein [Thermoguttaceae bacterium]|nr:biotin/lipoyl-binding protein [Thermoguttaceae bacterium]MBR4752792.1 biotin/lipoyl-binding protein [Thermoguttaceae bacterium]MBR5759201.1 biotin/lipoyl-binding protein [Thermoguttaceae bacterium]